MKIAIAYQYVYPQHFGGGEKRLFEVFSRFPDDVSIDYYPQHNENYSEYPELGRFNIIPLSSTRDPGGERSFKHTFLFALLLFLKLDIRKYDYVHIGQMPFFHILPLQIKKFCFNLVGIKTANLTIDWWEYWGKYWSKHNSLVSFVGRVTERIILKLVKNIIVISNKTERDIESVTSGKITLIHNGVNIKKIEASPVAKETDLVILGRLVEWKNVLMGIEVFEQMLLKDKSLKMSIIGSGPQRESIETYIKDNNLEDNITMHGFVADDEDIYAILKASKLMLLLSKQEGGGSITLFEANACGIPVATCYFENGIDEDLVTGQNGFFYREKSISFIAEELYQYISSKDDIKNYNTNCKEFVRQFDWERISGQYLDFFNDNLN